MHWFQSMKDTSIIYNAQRKKVNAKSSTKNACSSKPKEFLEKWKEIVILRMHTTTLVSQYRRIKKMKEVIVSSENKAKFIQIDWSENDELNETRSEKSQYLYISITTSVNTTIL